VKKLGVNQLSEYYEGANREISDNFFANNFEVTNKQREMSEKLLGTRFGFGLSKKCLIWVHFLVIGIFWHVLPKVLKLILRKKNWN